MKSVERVFLRSFSSFTLGARDLKPSRGDRSCSNLAPRDLDLEAESDLDLDIDLDLNTVPNLENDLDLEADLEADPDLEADHDLKDDLNLENDPDP